MKGAWLNSQEDLLGKVGTFSGPSYYGQGRAAPLLSLTEELTGSSPADGPVNFTVPYIEQYLVITSPMTPGNSLTTSLLTRVSASPSLLTTASRVATPAGQLV